MYSTTRARQLSWLEYCPDAKVAGLIPSHVTYKNQPVNVWISGTTNWCFSLPSSVSLKSINLKKSKSMVFGVQCFFPNHGHSLHRLSQCVYVHVWYTHTANRVPCALVEFDHRYDIPENFGVDNIFNIKTPRYQLTQSRPYRPCSPHCGDGRATRLQTPGTSRPIAAALLTRWEPREGPSYQNFFLRGENKNCAGYWQQVKEERVT